MPACPVPAARRNLHATASASAKPRKQRQINDPFALRKMQKFQYDDVPTLGHLILQRRRELLKYFRLAEHELPKLEGE